MREVSKVFLGSGPEELGRKAQSSSLHFLRSEAWQKEEGAPSQPRLSQVPEAI